jgi:hypothetical protein
LGNRKRILVPEGGEVAAAVAIYDEGPTAQVSFGLWHGHFEDPAQAKACFMWSLTPFYRLVQYELDGVAIVAGIERWEAGGWASVDSPVYFRNPAAPETWELCRQGGWLRREVQHAPIRPGFDYRSLEPEAQLDAMGLPADTRLGVHVVESGPPDLSDFMA